MCTQNNHHPHRLQSCRQDACYTHQAFWSKKKRLETLNNCLLCLKEKETDVRDAIAELEDADKKQGGKP